MLNLYTDRIVQRLAQITNEIQGACGSGMDFHDRLREFRQFCMRTPALAQVLAQLPQVTYDFSVDWRELPDRWPGGSESYAMRWSAIDQIVDGGTAQVDAAWMQLAVGQYDNEQIGLTKFVNMAVIPIYNYLVDHLQFSSSILYGLLRYKRWAEWFEADRLRTAYQATGTNGEAELDESLRQFLFESGVDYPYSQPATPRGKVDIVAGLETNDPLVLEVKIWDSNKGYKENRIRDGLRQVIDYSAKFGKDKGYVVVFNIDQEPLAFTTENRGEWPARIEHGSGTYFFIDVHIAEKIKPVSQQDKGKPVRTNEIDLSNLLNMLTE